MEIIESKENKLIKSLKKLKQKKYRDSENQFLAEGHKFLDYRISCNLINLRKAAAVPFCCVSNFIDK